MIKKLLILSFCFVLGVQASSLNEKIKNLMGEAQYQTHQNLVNFIFKNEQDFMINDQINYAVVLKKLQDNGLLNLGFAQPTEVEVTFHTNSDPIKSLKLLKESLKSLGYFYYFTLNTRFDGQGVLTWTIKLTTEAAINPLVLSNELLKQGAYVLDIEKLAPTKWSYKIDTSRTVLRDAIKLVPGERVKLNKPLTPYLIKVENSKMLYVASRVLNQWFPNVVFYDKHLNILRVFKEDKVYRNIKLKVPEGTTYIKISDLYTLINIKRGLSVIIKE